MAFGSGAMTNSIGEISEADVIFIIGSNTAEQHPIVASKVMEAVRRGARLIVADPRKTYIAERAFIHINNKPGSDLALINSMMNVIIEDGAYDEEFIRDRTENFEAVKQAVKECTPEWAESITGVSREDIRRAARTYAEAERSSILYCMGITQYVTGTFNVISLANLAMLTGNVGKRASGVNPLRGQNNVQGACDMGALPDCLSGYQKVTDAAAREKFSSVWNVKLPEKPGLTVSEMAGKIRAMYIIGENPAVTEPNLNHLFKFLENIEFLVVQDLFFTETARYAHVVLPAASFAEKDGTFTNTERRVQLVRKAIEPVGQSKADWKIIAELSAYMGYPMSYDHPSQIMDEIASLTPMYGGISYERLEKGGIQVPCPNKDHPGTIFLHEHGFARGKGKFIPVKYTPPVEEPCKEYPIALTTGRVLYHYHSGTMTRKVDFLMRKCPEAFIEINPEDAQKLSITDGESIIVESKRGKVRVKARVTGKIRKGVAFMPFHFAEAAPNYLTTDDVDPKAKTPQLKLCAVKLSREEGRSCK